MVLVVEFFDYNFSEKIDLRLIKVVLININSHLQAFVCDKLCNSAIKYILVFSIIAQFV